MRSPPFINAVAACAAIAIGIGVMQVGCDRAPTGAGANNNGPSASADGGQATARATSVLFAPSGERDSSSIKLERVASQDAVRVGSQYTYAIRVNNLTDQPLTGVTVYESLGDGLQFDSSQPPGSFSNQPPAQPSTRPSKQQQQHPQSAAAPSKQGGADPAATQAAATTSPATRPSGGPSRGQAVALVWYLGELPPKGTRDIQVTAIPTRVGQTGSCLAVTFNPTLCTPINVVNPALELTKQQVRTDAQSYEYTHLCDPITYKYVVRNAGTGQAKDVKISDDLPDGLKTADGKDAVNIDVGALDAGQSKDFTVTLRADQPGEFASRAVATSESDKAWSGKVTSAVREPKLDVTIHAPEWHMIGQAVTYRVDVTNTGDAVARETTLNLDAAGIGDDQKNRKLGTIAPGQTRTVNLTLRGDGNDLKLVASASSLCARKDKAASDEFVSVVRKFPALRLEAVDNVDPVPVGGNTVYTIQVKNQGSAPDQNIGLTAQLPEQMQFVEATGASKVTADGRNLKFEPLKTLAAGDVASWQITVKANRAGNARFKVNLDSEYLQRAVVEVEPTNAVQAQASR